ncbi:MAG: hypothetical protein ACRD3J_30225, partial [Thermoanaerobaculia bacterium]
MITTRITRVLAGAFSVSLAAACARPPATAPTPLPAPAPAAAPAPVAPPAPRVVEKTLPPQPNPVLPPVPHVDGPLAIKVIYPTAGALIQSKDSNFIFGSVGNGDATITINGVPAPVWPNGAFMAWLANPPADSPRYDIVALTATDSASLTIPVKIQPPAPPPLPGSDTIHTLVPARWASLIGPPAYASDTERVITGYALTGGIQRWFLMPNTIVKVTGTKNS